MRSSTQRDIYNLPNDLTNADFCGKLTLVKRRDEEQYARAAGKERERLVEVPAAARRSRLGAAVPNGATPRSKPDGRARYSA